MSVLGRLNELLLGSVRVRSRFSLSTVISVRFSGVGAIALVLVSLGLIHLKIAASQVT